MHRKVLGLAAVLLGALALLPSEADGQAKKNWNNKSQPVAASDQEYYLIQNQKTLTGQILAFDDSSHTVSVRINFPQWMPNPKFKQNAGAQNALMRDYSRLMQEQQRAMMSRNPRQMMQHYRNMMNFQNRVQMDMMRASKGNGQAPFMSVDNLRDFDFDLQQNVVYRKMFLPQEYDDTGSIKTYSKEEIAKLRGTNTPKGSYAATAAEFHPGQGVWIYLTPPSKSGTKTSSSSASSAKKEKEDDDNILKTPAGPPRPTVKMLVIFREGTVAPSTNNNQKNNAKKKKN